ncbi:DUF779 domain-containing protein [Pseudolysinimonas yzui]|uniref:DUF779 domain-containing protein n=1 Tax=Pseudolysinimonas yzui TaxID=2708254 RepID=A0A8J3GNP4_9MICO|nr:DUF779 domain-containing protein [Pseudolysinimonas yzui]GHF07941.1 hypothetical protein GCM10011600_05890 [Pseudolysinimonas yzui]
MVLHSAITRPGETRSRVALSEFALDLLRSLWRTHGPLMFHQSGGCCDGSSPMCYPADEFVTSDADVLLGVFDIALSGEPTRAVSFWMSAQQFEYWSHTHLTIDVVPGRGSGFSVEAPTGVRFLIRSELMDAREPFA